MHHVQLRSVSHRTYDLLLGPSARAGTRVARGLARFKRALNLTVGDSVVALVTPELGNGPFHLVVDPLPPPLTGEHQPVRHERGSLYIGAWALDYGKTLSVWEPLPDWDRITISDSRRRCLHQEVAASIGAAANGHKALRSLWDWRPQDLTKNLNEAVNAHDLPAVRTASSALSGLGPGLTPAGDDYLAGASLALWAGHHPNRDSLCRHILAGTVGRTTRLTRAYLTAASRGECDQRWHALLAALSTSSVGDGIPEHPEPPVRAIRRAVHSISTFGATSGTDMLSGFEAGLIWCSTEGTRA